MAEVKRGYVRPLDLKHGRVDLTHGSGGRAMVQLISELFAKHLGNEYLGQGNDGAVLPAPLLDGKPARLVMSTDSHVVSPLFFPGGDIGCLSVHGTVNDVAVMGATPLYLAAGFILEEGLPVSDLARIVESMADAAKAAGVPVVTGDTKVVERGKGDGVFITTTAVGVLPEGVELGGARAHPFGIETALIGAVIANEHHFVQLAFMQRPRSAPSHESSFTLTTTFDGTRIVDWLASDQLPRIC